MHTRDPVIIHQDLKPLNVMVGILLVQFTILQLCTIMQVTDDLKEVYICDMGLSKLKEASQATVTTVSKGPTGTYPYMAPEMFGQGHRGTAVDIYSLGCLFIELFGQKRIWPGLDGMQIMQKVCGSFNSPPEMPKTSHLNDNVSKICDACCQLEAKNRPSIAAVVEMLDTE